MKIRNLIILVLFFIPLICFAGVLSEGPTVNLVTPDSVTMVWKTEKPTLGCLELTTNDGKQISIVNDKSSTPSVEHKITLSNLKPETRYGYYVIASTKEFLFKSAFLPRYPIRGYVV